MVLENLLVNCGKNFTFGDTECDHGEVAGKTHINDERAGLGVHAADKHNVVDFFLFFQMVTIENDSVVNNLTNEADRRLCAVLVESGHVHVVHEEDEDLTSGGAENATSSLVNVRLNDLLKGLRVSEVVEIEGGSDGIVKVALREVILKDNSLTGTGVTNKEHTSLGGAMNLDKELLASSLGSGDNQVGEETIVRGIVSLDLVGPEIPVEKSRLEVVVKGLTTFGELYASG